VTVSEAAFNAIAAILEKRAGMVLTPNKGYLLESRLTSVARAHGFTTVADLGQRIALSGAAGALESDIVEAMLNNETFFFRDRLPFDMLAASILPELRKARAVTRRIRIWSAASSTGQEAYSIAMMLNEEAAQWQGWNIEIIGTDLSKRAVQRAMDGRYSQFEVQRGLSIQRLVRHFEKRGEYWELNPEIRRMVSFREMNLQSPWTVSGPFDVILCRNVLMYFGHRAKTDILARLHRNLAADGRLVLGAAETVLGISDAFAPDWNNRGLYVPVGEPAGAAA
jgi:chemotaxis protein methyltransferase CheR